MVYYDNRRACFSPGGVISWWFREISRPGHGGGSQTCPGVRSPGVMAGGAVLESALPINLSFLAERAGMF